MRARSYSDPGIFSVAAARECTGWNRVGDPARLADCFFARALDEYAVDDPVHGAVVRIVERAAAVARIGGAVQLKHHVHRVRMRLIICAFNCFAVMPAARPA